MKVKKSSWKYPFNNINRAIFKNDDNFVKVYNRNLTINSSLLNKYVRCHKGKVIGKLLITKQHLGFKLGSFFITKVLGERIAYRKKQKLLLKKNKNKQKLITASKIKK
jgi:ribosomal protein S19